METMRAGNCCDKSYCDDAISKPGDCGWASASYCHKCIDKDENGDGFKDWEFNGCEGVDRWYFRLALQQQTRIISPQYKSVYLYALS